ncbi:hypothetical protein KR093_006640 [Drosophila rubida]|uniref:Insulin-like domain-containing protein n=1 Tax=Drosophila rubida TaxID=30044 RepID=A0AAD4PLI8_9MUSC|nr:hypothetical protein KR093_006640 [Drosophila rubida]
MQFENAKYVLLICSLVIMLYQVETGFCGNGLTESLLKACLNGFNSRLKRTGDILPDTENNANLNTLNALGAFTNIDYDRQPLLYAMLGESAAPHMMSTRRRRYTIVEECCNKPCSQTELAQYCL